MSKKAVIDIGSLKVKVAIFDVRQKKLLFSQSLMTLLGKGVSEKHHILEESLQRLDEALSQIASELSRKRVKNVVIIGTEALRSADNVDVVHTLVEKHFQSHKLEVINQYKEADLFFTAVSREFPDHSILAMDVGGGSVQLIYGYYDSTQQQTVIDKRYSLKTGTYKLQQQYSPDNECISKDFLVAKKVISDAFKDINESAPILVFGSTCMLDFILASGVLTESDSISSLHPIHVTRNTLETLLEEVAALAPNKRAHYFPQGGYFMYGADYLLLNLLAAIDRIQPTKIYPTIHLNSAYAFI